MSQRNTSRHNVHDRPRDQNSSCVDMKNTKIQSAGSTYSILQYYSKLKQVGRRSQINHPFLSLKRKQDIKNLGTPWLGRRFNDFDIHYSFKFKDMCTPDHHAFIWFFLKPSRQSWKHTIVQDVFYNVVLEFPFTGAKIEVSYTKMRCVRAEVEDVQCPAQNT